MTTQKVSIRYLIDVAIGSPEPGIVNFNALYTVLQVICAKLDLEEEHIEIDSAFCQIGHTAESKSHASSERLMDHQIFDFGSDEMAEKIKAAEAEKRAAGNRSISEHVHVVFDGGQDDATNSKKFKDEKLANYRSELRQHIDSLNTRLGKMENIFATTVEVEQRVNVLYDTLHRMQFTLDELQRRFTEVMDARKQEDEAIYACRKKMESEKVMNTLAEFKLELAGIKHSLGQSIPAKPAYNSSFSAPATEFFEDMKNEHMRLESQLVDTRTHLCQLTQKLDTLCEKVGSGDSVAYQEAQAATHRDIDNLRLCVENAGVEIMRLHYENDVQKHTISDLTMHLEELSKTKIDKEEIDELLTDKADYTMLQRKVSIENMEVDRRKIEKQISELAECFLMNDDRVQKQIGEIRRLFGDRSLEEILYDLRVKIDREIQIVRDAVKKLAEAKPDADSAVARLRDLSCLACDQDVVMKCLEMNNLSKFGNAYVSQSFGPMITYEIGKLREAGKPGISDADDNIWDIAKNMRHSGGMHTIITSKDRVDKVTSVKARRK